MRRVLIFFRAVIKLRRLKQRTLLINGANDAYLTYGDKYYSPIINTLKKKLDFKKISSAILIYGKNGKDKKQFECDLIIDVFFQLLRLRLTKRTVWALLLTIAHPKIVISIDFDEALNAACKKKKIKNFYIQHGVICEDHMYFGSSIIRNMDNNRLPSGFLSWDDHSARNFGSIIESFVIGNIWLNRLLFEKDVITVDLNTRMNLFIQKFRNRPKILLTLTWGNPEITFLDDKMINLIKETSKEYHWLIKLHPIVYSSNEKLRDFENFLETNFGDEYEEMIEWREASSFPVVLLLKNCDLHITIESSCVIEAANCGIKSLVLNNKVILLNENGISTPPYGGPSYFYNERKNGDVEIWNNQLDIKAWIIQNKETKKPVNINRKYQEEEWHRFLRPLHA